MHRFFVNPSNISDSIYIDGTDVNHIKNVLRLKCGEEVNVCDGQNNEYLCKLTDISPDKVYLDIISKGVCENEPRFNITLYQGLPKSDKMEYIIQKCVELGVTRIVPVAAKRSVVKLKDDAKKVSRWQKIAHEAAKQCQRGILPEVTVVMTFKEAMDDLSKNDLSFMPYENERQTSLREVLLDKDVKTIGFFIGPEGGLDETEIAKADEMNIPTVSLGKRILRTETAPIACLSAVMYELDW